MASTFTAPLSMKEPGSEDTCDFSLVLGGPTFQLLRKSHLAGTALELLYRRIIVITLFAYLPLLLLNAFWPSLGSARVSFFHDVEVQVRLLIALPVLIGAELIVHSRIRPVVRTFVDRRLVLPSDFSHFDDAVKSAVKLRNSIPLELALLLLVYSVGLWVWHGRVPPSSTTWYAFPGGAWNLTPAGFWYVFVSIPAFQFILLRWYLRLFIWFRFLWQVSRIDLHLIPTHPDRCAGLSFLGKSAYAFGPILFAEGAILSGIIGSRILFHGEKLLSFRFQIGGFVVFFVFAILAPLVMFTPQMARVRRKGLAEYGLLAQRYVEKFEQKWVRKSDASEELLGTGDIQSLADLGNSYDILREMRPIPFGVQDMTRLAAATAAPLIPLLLTIFSPEELIMRIIKFVF